MRISIHQPDFIPWLGMFHKIALSEQMIFLDHIQAQRGKSWTSRNKIIINGEARWLTIPIKRKGISSQDIVDIDIDYDSLFERKHLGAMKHSYSKAPYFKEIYAFMQDMYSKKYRKLVEFNKEYIRIVSQKIGIKTEFISSTELLEGDNNLKNMKGNDLILHMCLKSGADEYVSGAGCTDFIRPREFEKKGISFYFQKFDYPEYNQVNVDSFVSHLSSLDALFNVGFKGIKGLIDGQGTGVYLSWAELFKNSSVS